MAIQQIVKMGNQQLASVSVAVSDFTNILFPQRIKNLRYFGFEDEIKNMI